jgi:hypothetical protein
MGHFASALSWRLWILARGWRRLAGDEGAYFVYTGQSREDIPPDVIRVRVHPSIRRIKDFTFPACLQVDLGEGLEEIGKLAFWGFTSLQRIVIPPSVRVIHQEAFSLCSHLTIVILGKGLERIGAGVFYECTLLCEIVIPAASCRCTLLHKIVIPHAVRKIEALAFDVCSQLTNVHLCNEIEEFESGESMRDWWSHGVHERSLSTYCFLVQFNIPQRLGLVRPRKWHANIHGMLRCIPSISPKDSLDSYFDSIDSKLSVYKNLDDAPMLLELAIWKLKITKINGPLTTKMWMQYRTDSVMMVTIIVPSVLSFLTDDNGRNNVVYGENYDEGNEGDDDKDEDDDDTKEDNDVDGNGSKESDDGDEGDNDVEGSKKSDNGNEGKDY